MALGSKLWTNVCTWEPDTAESFLITTPPPPPPPLADVQHCPGQPLSLSAPVSPPVTTLPDITIKKIARLEGAKHHRSKIIKTVNVNFWCVLTEPGCVAATLNSESTLEELGLREQNSENDLVQFITV